MKSEIKKIAVEVLSSSSITGVSNLVRTDRKLIQIIWSTCILASFSLCSFLVVQSILDYMQFEVTTKIRKVHQFPSQFPKLTICNSNPFATKYGIEFFKEQMKYHSINDAYFFIDGKNEENNSLHYVNELYDKIDFTRYLVRSMAMSSRITDEERQKLGFKIEEILLSCTFAGYTCDASNFEWMFLFDFGNCFTFKPNRSITRTGKFDGLILELLMGIDENLQTYTLDSGIYVYIGNDSISTSTEEAFGLPFGFENNIVIDRMFTTQLKKPYSDCDLEISDFDSFNSYSYKQVFRLNKTYSRKSCFDICYQQFVNKNCNCSDMNFMNLPQTAECLSDEEIKCVFEAYEKFGNVNIIDLCGNECPLECKSESFSVSTTLTIYPSMMYASLLKKHPLIISRFLNSTNSNPNDRISITQSFLRNNILKLNAYYDKLNYIHVTEMPTMNIVTLLSNVGGQLGLFLGFSFLSLFEFVELLVEITCIIFSGRILQSLKKLFKRKTWSQEEEKNNYGFAGTKYNDDLFKL